MDLDDLDVPTQVPSRISRFAPKSSKPIPKPKLEPQESVAKSGPEVPISKPKPQEFDAEISKRKDDVEEGLAQAPTNDTEPSASNGAMKMEVEPKSEGQDESKQDDLMDEEDGEDTIVREIDVFLSPSIDADTKLYVLQYPLRPCWRPFELDERCEEVRVKPVSAQVEVDLSVDVDSKNYDHESKLGMTKQLHLNPIHAVVQLRSSLQHLRTGGSKQKTELTTNAKVTVKAEDNTKEKSISASKRQSRQLESSSEQNMDGPECWIPLKYHSSNSDLSTRYLQRMVAQETSSINFTMNPYDYVTSLCPGASNNNFKSTGPSWRSLLELPTEERIKKMLCEASVHRFSVLKHYAPEYSEEELLEVLQRHAILIHGLWAPKSNLLFSETSRSPDSIARDYALCIFWRNFQFKNSQLSEMIPQKFLKYTKVYLEEFGVQRPVLKDWRFKENADVSFIKDHPYVIEKQDKIWEVKEKELKNILLREEKGKPRQHAASKSSMNSKFGQSGISHKSATESASGVLDGRMTMTNETREALPKVLLKVFHSHKVCSFQLICAELRRLAVSLRNRGKEDAMSRMGEAAAYGVDAPPEELQASISQVAESIHGHYVLKSSLEHPEYDPLRHVVFNLLKAGGPDAKLKKAEIFVAAKNMLKRDITNNEYIKVMNEICNSSGSAWVLKRGDGS
ncbi:DNA-directed RNA polymerase III subunit RPC5 [Quillaja saponaria]|uniref:DNA-directed RNA polymerase III subunit RPC5 n=1 Tax=Quillaja saponaria TaxID=32244 RepID=A0AAD7KSU3_QUISA|nr:DNA-directed RNA polymerase III subunit RPC5 [Quillaja saponaria]